MIYDNTHPCEHCGNIIDYDQTDWCDKCDTSIFDDKKALVDENGYPLLEGTINLTKSPIEILADYVRVRYGTNQSFENMVSNLINKDSQYSKIEQAIIRYTIDGSQTAGELTKEILNIINKL